MINDFAHYKIYLNTPCLRRSVYISWVPVTQYDLTKMIALLIAMGLDKQPHISDYWSTDEMKRTPWYSSMFSRERFQTIYQTMLHVSPSNSEKKRLNLFWITLFQISKSHSTHSKMLQLMRWLFIIKADGKTSNITHQNQVNITSRHMDCVIVPLGSHIIYWLTLDLIHRTVLKSIIKVTPKIFLNIY